MHSSCGSRLSHIPLRLLSPFFSSISFDLCVYFSTHEVYLYVTVCVWREEENKQTNTSRKNRQLYQSGTKPHCSQSLVFGLLACLSFDGQPSICSRIELAKPIWVASQIGGDRVYLHAQIKYSVWAFSGTVHFNGRNDVPLCESSGRECRGEVSVNCSLLSHHGWLLLNPQVHQSLTSPGFKSRIEHGPYWIE